MTRINFDFDIDISELLDLVKDFDGLPNDLEDAMEDVGEDYSDRMARDAPVLTGMLRDTLMFSNERLGELNWALAFDDEEMPYLWRQNYEHRSKSGFVTKHMATLEKTLEKAVGKVLGERI